MRAFYLDDVPEEPFTIEPPEDIDLDNFDGVVAYFVKPDATEITAANATLTDDSVLVDFEEGAIFTEPGLWSLIVTLMSDTALRRLPAIRFVVQVDDGWHTLDSAREQWRDSVDIEDDQLWELLEVAKHQCLEYAPAIAVGAAVPISYRKAQLMQARNVWNAARVDPSSGAIGDDSFALTPFPLDWTIKQVLRPKRAVPVVF